MPDDLLRRFRRARRPNCRLPAPAQFPNPHPWLPCPALDKPPDLPARRHLHRAARGNRRYRRPHRRGNPRQRQRPLHRLPFLRPRGIPRRRHLPSQRPPQRGKDVTGMTLTLSILAIAIFLGGAASGVFVLLTVSIRRGQRTRYLSKAQSMREGHIARRVLTGIRNETDDRKES